MNLRARRIFEKLLDIAVHDTTLSGCPSRRPLELALEKDQPIPQKALPGALLNRLTEEDCRGHDDQRVGHLADAHEKGKTMKYLLILTAAILFCELCVAEDGMEIWKRWKPDVEKAARAYLEKYSTPKERKKWNEWMDERLETRSLETVSLDWLADNEKRLTERDPKKIREACYLFLKMVDTGTAPPMQVRDRMTDENFQTLIEYLSSEAKKEGPMVVPTSKR